MVEKNCKNIEDLPRVISYYNNMPHSALPINTKTGTHLTRNDFEEFEKNSHRYLDPNQEPHWLVEGETRSLLESIENFTNNLSI